MIEALAPIERAAGSEGERQAAEWIAERLTAAGADAHVDVERFRGDWAGRDRGALARGRRLGPAREHDGGPHAPGSPAGSPRRG